MKDIPNNFIKLIITRYPPKWLDVKKYTNAHIVKSLSPSQDLLLRYKENNNWNWYVSQFTKEMTERDDMKSTLTKLKNALLNGKNICLVCYEKDYMKCHRSLIGEYLKSQGIEWKEL